MNGGGRRALTLSCTTIYMATLFLLSMLFFLRKFSQSTISSPRSSNIKKKNLDLDLDIHFFL
jgi:hypothetical protein